MNGITITADTIIKFAEVVGALGVIFGIIFAIYKWYLKQNKQDEDIKITKDEIKALKEEQCLLTYGVLACLKGLAEQGCDGPVKEAIGKIEKHINQQAHK